MKKVIMLLLVLTIVAGAVSAFDILSFPPPVRDGSIMIDAGIGLRYISWESFSTRMQVPPLWFQVEYALPVGVPISVGGGFSFTRRVGTGAWVSDNLSVMYFTPQIRGNWHWGFPVQWLDFYTGIGMGLDIFHTKYTQRYWTTTNYSNTDVRFYWGFHVGAHFYFSDVIGVVAETGYPFYLKAGVALKFGGR